MSFSDLRGAYCNYYKAPVVSLFLGSERKGFSEAAKIKIYWYSIRLLICKG